MQHTAGPWHADEHMVVRAANGDLICDVDPFDVLDAAQANLRLIAAAPEQYALLMEAHDLMSRVSENDPMAAALGEWCMRARIVIVKVEAA
jgi:hypothetical protein